jgi:hypothetical protein
MPPFLPQAPLDALGASGAPRWVEVALAAVAVACEPWALALLGVALYSWLEREVRGVIAAAAPLGVALLAGSGLAAAAHAAWAAPRAAGAGEGLVPVLHGLLPGAQILALATFVAWSLLVYRWRGFPALLLAAAGVAAQAHAGPRWAPDLAAGAVGGLVLAVAAYGVTLRMVPDGHLARRRAARGSAAARSP